ncbi:MAG: COX15/CtaA family protein [Ktedonobacterales bacterium]
MQAPSNTSGTPKWPVTTQDIRRLLNDNITPSRVRLLAISTSIGIFLVYFMGTLVTDSGSGHGCGASWPLCQGRFIPQFAISTAIEFSHRVVVALVSVLVCALAIGILWLWRSRRELLILAFVMVPALAMEAGLGAALVLLPQSALLLALHFGSSTILVISILLATLIILELDGWDRLRDRPVPTGFRVLTFTLVLYTYVVGYLGAYMRLRGVELGCSTWPLCNGQVFPGFTGAAGIAFSHRFAAVFLIAGSLALFFWARRIRLMRPDLYRGSVVVLVAVAAQALAGALVVFTRVAEASQMLHAGLVSLIFSALCYVALQTLPRPVGVRSLVAKPASTPSPTARPAVTR